LDGPSLTLSAACASGLHALIRGAMMIRSGEADRVLVVAAEASVSPIFLGSFRGWACCRARASAAGRSIRTATGS
jgi:3-oxoacyl-(acyl-carrier-protein) synthase